jgi:type IV secretory pathway VirB10-like protein
VILIISILIILFITGAYHKKKPVKNVVKQSSQSTRAYIQTKNKAKNLLKTSALPALPPLNPGLKRKIKNISKSLPILNQNSQNQGPTLAQKAALSPMVQVVGQGGFNNNQSQVSKILNQQSSLQNLQNKAKEELNSVPNMEKNVMEQAKLAQLEKTNPNAAFLAKMKAKKENYEKVLISQKPVSGCEVEAGTIIPAVLLSRINSNLPGFIKAETVNNVYSYNGQCLEIPKGTFLIGMYSSQIAANQSRLLVAFKTLELPDGRQLNLLGMPGMTGRGTAGFHDLVNTHFWTMFGTSLLLSFINVGSQAYGAGTGAMAPSAYGGTAPVGAAGVGEETLSNTAGTLGQNMLSRYANIPPTLIIRQGFRFNVFVSKNMVLPRQN